MRKLFEERKLFKGGNHGLRTSNEGINQRYLKNWAVQCGRQNMLRPYLKIWEWELIFGCAVKVISSPGVCSPWVTVCQITAYQLRNLKIKSQFDSTAVCST